MKTFRAIGEWLVLLIAVTVALAAGTALLQFADPLRIFNPVHYTREVPHGNQGNDRADCCRARRDRA
jgi:hypothetical protein